MRETTTRSRLEQRVREAQPNVRALIESLPAAVRPRLASSFTNAKCESGNEATADWDNDFTDTFHNWADRNAPDAIYEAPSWRKADA